MAHDELVEVIEADGSPPRVVTRAEMRAARLRHRCTFVVVRSSQGQVLVHLRSPDKDLWPSRWDLCCGGVVAAGEDWESAAVRELAEELGVAAGTGTRVDLELLGDVEYADEDVSEVGRVWSIVHDGPFEFADGEVIEARFVALGELAAMLAETSFVPDSAAVVAPLLLS